MGCLTVKTGNIFFECEYKHNSRSKTFNFYEIMGDDRNLIGSFDVNRINEMVNALSGLEFELKYSNT